MDEAFFEVLDDDGRHVVMIQEASDGGIDYTEWVESGDSVDEVDGGRYDDYASIDDFAHDMGYSAWDEMDMDEGWDFAYRAGY